MSTRMVKVAGWWIQPARVVWVIAQRVGRTEIRMSDGSSIEIWDDENWSYESIVRAINIEFERAERAKRSLVVTA